MIEEYNKELARLRDQINTLQLEKKASADAIQHAGAAAHKCDAADLVKSMTEKYEKQLAQLRAQVQTLRLEGQTTIDAFQDFEKEVHRSCKCLACMLPLDNVSPPLREKLEQQLRVACTCLACVRNKGI